MALDFTTIKDQPGAAAYLIHDGSQFGADKMTRLAEQTKRRTEKQIVVMSAKDGDGRKILEFYGLTEQGAILIVRDDDQLFHVWNEAESPGAEQVAHMLEYVG